MDPAPPGLMTLNERAAPQRALPSFPPRRQKPLLARYGAAIDAVLRSSLTPGLPFTDTPAGSTSLFMLSLHVQAAVTSGATRGESPDAPENLHEQVRRQVALSELQDEVPGMPDQAAASLEGSLLEARQRPALDGAGEGEPAQQIPEVVGDDAQEQPHLIGAKAVTGEPGAVDRGLALLDPLLRRPALVVEADDRPVRPGQGGDDETHAGEEFPEVMLDLGDHAPRPVPGGSLRPVVN